ncbi:MAG: TetR family transcriptional regulator [Halioglobus sp.]
MGSQNNLAQDIATPVSTRQKLLLTAMRLYARKGLHGVSLRSISAAAGSKNSAAMHYHFSNRAGVIAALIDMIAQELQAIADKIREEAPEHPSLREAFRNTVRPLTQLPVTQPWGADAIRFMSKAIAENDPEIAAAINPVYGAFWQRIDNKLAKLVPELPPKVRKLRLMFMSVNAFHGVAEVASLAHTPLGDLSHFNNDQLLDHLVDYLIGGLKAPSHASQ